ncbi:MAG: flavodoxin domain-containing protein [candidate division WOR-3 bacterium]|jgi:flavorubredoxin|nr:flavodoxin domain-containing protein [candidate division WOR-3 bacterium]MCR4423443.1 flavodoxin domain-containing protein [candidate division WOR-3 bacterium]MDH7518782.1 flavodoxin domain-containing protein [bacterium]
MEHRAVQISDRVYWVGAIDWAVRDFHGYSTNRGTTYNAYLIIADKVTLIDTVKAPFKDELLSRISSVISPEKIDYIVSNHAEMDHSGALPAIIEAVKPNKVFASVMGVKALKEHFHFEQELIPVKDGDSLSLGSLTLNFLETRMLHWPDSMVSYLVEERLLFSQDGFGMHWATGARFADELNYETLRYEGAKYYANILLPYSTLVLKLIERLRQLQLPIDIIAPDHGPIWRKDPMQVVYWYQEWAEQRPKRKAVVVYDTMWGSTDILARVIADALAEKGIETKVMRLRANDRSDVMTEILDAGAIVFGSPTLNNNIFPTVADVLTYIKGLKPKNKLGAIFGSYGWSGEAVSILADELKEMGVELVAEPLRVKYVPDKEALGKARELGYTVAERLIERGV